MRILVALLGSIVPSALAMMPPIPNVPSIPGYGAPSNVIVSSILPTTAGFMLRLASALGLLFVVIAGAQLIGALGDDSKISKHKLAIVYALGGLTLSILSQGLVSVVATYNYTYGNPNDFVIGGVIRYAIDILLTLMNILFVLIIIFQGFRMVLAQGKTDEFNKMRQAMLWAVIGAIVINTAHALLRAVTTFFAL